MTAASSNEEQKKLQQQQHLLDIMSDGHIRVAVVGNVDAGKSTMIGTLSRSQLDDGNGSSRNRIAKHQHEIDSGRTSTISSHLMGFDESGQTIVVPKNQRSPDAYIAQHAHERTVSLMDMAGHEKYFKTTIAGLSRGMADYALVLVNASHPPTHMTVHHLNLCHVCGIPVIIVLTKLDSCPSANVLRHTKKRIQEILRADGMGKKAYAIYKENDIDMVQDKLHALVPVVQTSCVTGEGLDMIRKLLRTLPQRRKHRQTKSKRPYFELLVEDQFNVPGVGLVLSGFVNAGHWRKGEPIYVGPLKDGSYLKTSVKSAHVAQTLVDEVWAGHSACFAVSLTKAQRQLLARKSKSGMVVLKEPVPLCDSFYADICFTKGESVTMRKGQWNTTMNILHLQRTCRMIDFEVLDNDVLTSKNAGDAAAISNDEKENEITMVLRPGQRARVKFAFLHGRPNYLRKGMRVMLRDGHVRGIGIITQTTAISKKEHGTG